MLKENYLTRYHSMCYLFLALLFFSNCQKETGKDSQPLSETLSATDQDLVQGTIHANSVRKEEGFAFVFNVNSSLQGDSQQSMQGSQLRIFEDGKEIGPAHAPHSTIRDTGKGQFSHWGSKLYFSSTDNTDPRTNGRKYTYALSSGVSLKPVVPSETPAVASSEALGYAMVNGQTTGGKGGRTVTVSTLPDLKNALSASAPLIVQVSGKISGNGYINVSSNKTIMGLKGSSLEGVSLLVYGTNNVIIRNMTIRKVKGYSNIIIKEGAHHVWVDHCDLSSDRNNGWEYYDGLLDVGKGADYVTLSWNKMYDNHIACLIGWGTPDHDKLRVTLHNNHFFNISERAPDMRFGQVHYFNNLNENNSGYSVSALEKGTVRTDNNYFSNCIRPITTTYNGYTAGYISGASTNVYVNSGKNNLTTSASNWLPPYEYKSALIPASEVPSVVRGRAGATLL